MRIPSADRVAFLFPLALPVLLGLVSGFVQLVVDLSETGTLVRQGGGESGEFVKIDFLNLLKESTQGVTVSLFSVHIWALTTLFATANRLDNIARGAFYYPVLGLVVHFLLVTIVVSFVNLEDSFREANAQRELQEELLSGVGELWEGFQAASDEAQGLFRDGDDTIEGFEEFFGELRDTSSGFEALLGQEHSIRDQAAPSFRGSPGETDGRVDELDLPGDSRRAGAEGTNEDADGVGDSAFEDRSGDKQSKRLGAAARNSRLVSTLAMCVGFGVAFVVRRSVWLHCESFSVRDDEGAGGRATVDDRDNRRET